MPLFVFIAQSLRVCQFVPPAGAKRERVEAKNNYVVDGVPTCWLQRALLGVSLCFVNSLFYVARISVSESAVIEAEAGMFVRV